MGPASLQEEEGELEEESKGEMEGYRCLLQAGSQLESTLQRECPSLLFCVATGRLLDIILCLL